MKLIRKTSLIIDNSGETMVEVLVAFTLLSIMLVIFSQGIAWASKSEMNATKNRNNADTAMKDLQHALAANDPGNSGTPVSVGDGTVTPHTYTYIYDGAVYQYTVYTAG